jgi:hypothetical protein
MEDSFANYAENFEEIFSELSECSNEKIREKTHDIVSTYRLFSEDQEGEAM